MSNSSKGQNDRSIVFSYLRNAALGGAGLGGLALAGTYLLGLGSGENSRILLEAMLPSTRFLCSAVMTATATVLSLMLALLSFSGSVEEKLSATFFQRIRAIAIADTVVFIAASFLLLCISVPLNESDNLPEIWFDSIYFVTLLYTCFLSGALISIMLMLYGAVKAVIVILHPEMESEVIDNPENEQTST